MFDKVQKGENNSQKMHLLVDSSKKGNKFVSKKPLTPPWSTIPYMTAHASAVTPRSGRRQLYPEIFLESNVQTQYCLSILLSFNSFSNLLKPNG